MDAEEPIPERTKGAWILACVQDCRWRMDEEDAPMLHQYVEFKICCCKRRESVKWCGTVSFRWWIIYTIICR